MLLTRRRPQVALVAEKANRNPPREYKGKKEDEGSWAPPPTREKHRREHQILVAMASRTAMGPPHSLHEAWVRVTRSRRGCVGQIGEPAHRYGSHQHTAASFGVAPLAVMGVLICVGRLNQMPILGLGQGVTPHIIFPTQTMGLFSGDNSFQVPRLAEHQDDYGGGHVHLRVDSLGNRASDLQPVFKE